MKTKLGAKMAMVLGLAVTMIFSPTIAAMASTETAPPTTASKEAATPAISRTKAWDSIENTLGVPESVRKIEYAESVFYLGKDVTEADFLAVLTAGPEAVRLKPPVAANVSRMYFYPVYILWNKDKTVLLVHPIIYDDDKVLDAVAVPTEPPASLTGAQAAIEKPKPTLTEKQEYMLSEEYADAVRDEFYRLLNEHRVANGLKKLEISVELQGYADMRAEELRTVFSHKRPDGTPAGSGWHNMWNVMNSRYAENIIGVGTLGADPASTAASIFTSWKNSKGHNKHMLYDFDPKIKMAFGITPKLDEKGFVTSGAVFASGY